ncbi:MAG: hypothetical protein ACLR23_08355 [Clostridia bacterium]
MLDSLKIAVKTTLLALAIGYPFAYCMAKLPHHASGGVVMVLVIVPFWTQRPCADLWMDDFAAGQRRREYPFAGNRHCGCAAKAAAHRRGGSVGDGLFPPSFYDPALSYTSIEKMDWSLVEAARDLGAGKMRAFLTVTLERG